MKYEYDNETLCDRALKQAIHKHSSEGSPKWWLEAWCEAWRRGWREEIIRIAGNLKKEGLSAKFIAKATSLSIEEVEKL
ncbi:MAG TPA: hypothetical protein VFE53_08935 [Mucilaginibacter sp.]|nr:hypothetical protein [Mucilaginibacter sp.]